MSKLDRTWVVSVLVFVLGSVRFGVVTRQVMWYYRRNSTAWWWLCPTHWTNREHNLSWQTHRRHVWFDGKQPWITCTLICKSCIIIQSSICCLVRQSTKSHMLYGCYSRHVALLSSLVTDMTYEWFVYIRACVQYLNISKSILLSTSDLQVTTIFRRNSVCFLE
jgi:hypothetical protein